MKTEDVTEKTAETATDTEIRIGREIAIVGRTKTGKEIPIKIAQRKMIRINPKTMTVRTL